MCVCVHTCACKCVCLEREAGNEEMREVNGSKKPVTAFWSILQLKMYWDLSEVIARLHLATADPAPEFLSLLQRALQQV